MSAPPPPPPLASVERPDLDQPRSPAAADTSRPADSPEVQAEPEALPAPPTAPAIVRRRRLLPPPDPVPQPPADTGSIDRLATVIQAHRDGIFIIAHPSCETGLCNFTAEVEKASDSTVIETVTWTGPFLGKPYTTRIRFTPSFDEGGNVSSVAIDPGETNDPFPPAFGASETGKRVALLLLGDWLRSKQEKLGVVATSGYVATRLLDRSLTVKDMIGGVLVYLAKTA